MRKILLLGLVLSSGFCAELKMKDVDTLIEKRGSDVLVIDAKELRKYIKEKKEIAPTVEHIEVLKGITVVTDIGDPINGSAPIVEATPIEIKKERFTVDGLEAFKSSLLIGNSKDVDILYSLNLQSALEITKYIFSQNMKEKYPKIKEILLIEGKKIDAIDFETFSSACENMSEGIADEMIAEFGALI